MNSGKNQKLTDVAVCVLTNGICLLHVGSDANLSTEKMYIYK